MMKKLVLIFALLLFCTIALSSCQCEHIWDKGTVKVVASDTSDGEILYRCLECGKERIEKYHTAHAYTNNWGHDESGHWLICDREGCNVTTNKGIHSFNEKGLCPICGKCTKP